MSMLHGERPHGFKGHQLDRLNRIRRLVICAIAALVVLVIAAACADDTENRQFANDPRTPSPTEPETVDISEAASPVATRPPLPSPEALVDRRGAPPAVYAYVGGTLRVLDSSGARVVLDGPIAAFDASPSGDRVAVVTTSPGDGGETVYGIEILDAAGEVVQQFDTVLAVSAQSATPVAGGADLGGVSLSWAPQGRHILLSHPSGQLIDISLDGDIQEIETRSSIEGVVSAEWSPRGDAIGVLIRRHDGLGELAIVETGEEAASVNVIAPVGDRSGQAKTVEQFAWKANGSGLVYIESTYADSEAMGGKIVAWDRSTNTSRIVATGGQAGPSGSIRSFSISPDGKAVVYEIALPGGEGWSFNGLYVRSLNSGQLYRVPIAAEASVVDVWWTSDGLIWTERQESTAGAPLSVVLAAADGEQVRVGTISTVAHAAPMASPVTASPVASPSGATPVVIPDAATPVS